MAEQKMRGADAVWLHMDEPSNLMTVTAAVLLAGPLDAEALTRLIDGALVERFPQLRRRLIRPTGLLGAARWADDPDFSTARHVQVQAPPSPGDAGLAALAGELIGRPLPLTRPPWRIVLVDDGLGGHALIGCFHRCLVDSFAAARLLLSLSEEGAADSRTAVSETASAAIFPRLLSAPADPQIMLKGALGAAKRAAWSAPIPLETAERIAAALGETLQAVTLTAVTGALRRHLEDRASLVDSVSALVSADLRPLNAEPAPDSRAGLSRLALPLGRIGPKERLEALRAQGLGPGGSVDVLDIAALSPGGWGWLERQVLSALGARASLTLVELAGPSRALTIQGAAVRGLALFPPRPGGLGLGLGLVRVAGQVSLSVASDAGLVPNPQAIADAFVDAFAELEALAAPQAAPAPQAASAPGRCQATTRAGARCKNRAKAGSRCCGRHQGQA